MSVVIVDVREWQRMFNLSNGEKVDIDSAVVNAVRCVMERHPYPGDMERLANRWVTDTALDLVSAYEPRLVFLSYAQQYFAQRFIPLEETVRRKMIKDTFGEALRFVAKSGYKPVFVGTGDMVELKGEMDLSMLDALVSSVGGSARYAGLHKPSEKDLLSTASLPGVDRLVSREEWMSLFPDEKCDPARLPEYLLVCREGWTVRSVGTSPRINVRVQGCNPSIPVSTSLGTVAALTDIRGLIEDSLERNPVVLIVIEGVGERNFPLPFTACINGVEWYCYEPGEGQYLTLSTGAHQVFAYPPGHRISEDMTTGHDYPFSGFFKEVPEHTLGSDFRGKSIAVGNRSMFTHMVFGAGISIECFARNLYNQGCIAVVKDGAIGTDP